MGCGLKKVEKLKFLLGFEHTPLQNGAKNEKMYEIDHRGFDLGTSGMQNICSPTDLRGQYYKSGNCKTID